MNASDFQQALNNHSERRNEYFDALAARKGERYAELVRDFANTGSIITTMSGMMCKEYPLMLREVIVNRVSNHLSLVAQSALRAPGMSDEQLTATMMDFDKDIAIFMKNTKHTEAVLTDMVHKLRPSGEHGE